MGEGCSPVDWVDNKASLTEGPVEIGVVTVVDRFLANEVDPLIRAVELLDHFLLDLAIGLGNQGHVVLHRHRRTVEMIESDLAGAH